jgi:hypothetical protein
MWQRDFFMPDSPSPVYAVHMNSTDSIGGAFSELWTKILTFLPNFLIAVIMLIIGWIVASALGGAARRIVHLTRIDALVDRTGATATARNVGIRFTFADIIGWIVKWFVFVAVLIVVADTLHWPQITLFLNRIALFIPNVVVAVVIVAIGLAAGSVLEGVITRTVEVSRVSTRYAAALGAVGKWALIGFAVSAALVQLNIAPSLINILFGGVVGALALAFGLGGRERAAMIINRMDTMMEK